MVNWYCCVAGCNAAEVKRKLPQKYPWMSGVSFHSFPRTRLFEQRKIWLDLIRRDKTWQPNKFTRICSMHFVDGQPTTGNPHPTIFPYNNWGRGKPARKAKGSGKDNDSESVMASTVNHVIAPQNPVIINGLQVFSPTNASDISIPTDDDSVTPSSIKSEPVDTGYDTGTSISKTQVPQLQIIAPDNAPCTVAPSTPGMPTSIIQGTRIRQAVTYIVKNPTSQTIARQHTAVAAPVTATSVVGTCPMPSKRQVVVPIKTVRTSAVQQGATPRPVFLVPSMATTTTRTTPVYISQSAVAPHKPDSTVVPPKADPNNVVCGLVYNSKSPQDSSAMATKRKEYLCNFCFFRNENYTTLSNHLATHIFTCNHCSFKAFTRHEVIMHKQKKHFQFPADLHSTINAQINVGLSSSADTANNVTVTMSRVSAMPSTLGVVKSIVVTSTMTNVTQTSSARSQSVVTATPTVVASRPVSEVTTTSSTAVSSPMPDRAMADQGKTSSYFTYKIHEYSERETMYECDICLYMTKELYDMYDHATTHNIGDSLSSASVDPVTDTPGLIWECLYCSFRVEKQSVLVTHIKSAHVGKTLKMRRQWVSPSSMSLLTPPTKDIQPLPKKVTPVPKSLKTLPDTSLVPVTSDGNIDTQATLWGCYYCSSFHTFDRSAAIAHVQTTHKGQKLMITRRRVVSTSGTVPPNKVSNTVSTTKQDTSSSKSTTGEGKSRRKQSLTTSRTVVVARRDLDASDSRLTMSIRPRKPSKYDSMIAFLNHSNEMIRQQINEIDSGVGLSVPGSSIQSGVSDQKMLKSEKSDDAGLPAGSSLLSLRKAAEQADTVHLSKLPDDLKIDWQKYFTIDRAASIAKCLKCNHECSGKHAFSHMRAHITVHTLERLWGCPYCDHCSSRRIFMYKHVVSQHAHRPVLLVRRRPYRVPSGPASRRFKNRNAVVDLMPTRRLQGPRSIREAKVLKDATDMFVCPSCSRTSVFRGDIRTHIKFVHPESNPQSLRGEVVLRPPAMPSDGVMTTAHMKTASVHLVRLEDVPKFTALKKIVDEKGDMLHHDLDINNAADDDSEPTDTTEMLVLPNSSEMGKYGCPYCVYKTFRPLVVKQHILYRHPDDEIKVCDLRIGSLGKRSKFLYPCALLSCQFLTPMKEALYAHIGKNPLHVGNTVTETLKDKDKCSSDDEPIAKIATRCSSLRSASLKYTPTGSADSTVEDDGMSDGIFSVSNDPVLVQFISDLKGGVATPRLLLKCRYCDLPSSYDPVTIKDHLIREHPSWDPVVLDVKARFYRQESRLYMCPLLSCDFMTYTSREFVSHLKRVHTDTKFLLPVINCHARKTKSNERRTKGTKRKHVHVSKSDSSKRAKPLVAKNVNSNKESYPYLCFYCKISCDDRRSVKEHLLMFHPGEYWFVCFSEKARILHKKSKVYLCKSRTCDFFSHSLDDYNRHPCVVEERASTVVTAPAAHSDGNSPEKMYQCSYCTCMMTNVHDIREHVLMEHKSSSGGYTEIQTGFGKNGTIVMNVNSEVTCPPADHLDKNGMGVISSSDVDLNESSDISNFASPVSKRMAEQNGLPAVKHTDIGIDSVSSQVKDIHTKLNAVMETLHRKKHERSQKAEDRDATTPSVGKLTLKLSNNVKSGSTEDKVCDTVTGGGESDVDMPEEPRRESPLSTCENGQAEDGDLGDNHDGSSGAQDTEKSVSAMSKSHTQGKDDTVTSGTPGACPGSKDLSDQEEGEAGSDSREAGSDSTSDNDKLDDEDRRGSEDCGQLDVPAGGETNCDDTETSETLKAADEDDHTEMSEVTEQQRGSGDSRTGGDGETNKDPDPPNPPVTISIKITPPKDGWKARRSHGSSSSSDSTDDDSGESDQEDEDVDSTDSDNSDSDSSSD